MKLPREKKVLSIKKQEHINDINEYFKDFYGTSNIKDKGLLNFFKFLEYDYKEKIGHSLKKNQYLKSDSIDITFVKILKMCQELNIKTIQDYERIKNC